MLLALALALVVARPVAAQTVRSPSSLPHADVANEAISQLRSPFCPGLMLAVCPSDQAAALRDSIHVLAARGWSAHRLVEWMISRHGEEWRALPKRSGPGLWAWVIPPLVLIGGAAYIVGRLRRARAVASVFPAPSVAISSADREQLAVALRQWEEAEEAGEVET
ncbi:MAG TPA: cytochrome c-type biogenesis protein CcmH [Longimicrobiaceae bacterium]|nr:cytochrome c-type biogenesis protein CcmH [Longimicrobiaceae bacterium]